MVVGKIKLSADGRQLNKKDVRSIQRLPDGEVQIITEYQGRDNKQKALIRNIYLLEEKRFVMSKEVQFGNSDEWITRNEYAYTK